MNIVTIEELAKTIANKHHLSQQEADAFVNSFFKNIRNCLATEKLVKVRGLGTFAVSVMKSTEYPGRRCKVMTFSPEAKLSKQINKPFAQFEVVTLADGVTFDDVTEETGDDSLIKAVVKEELSVDDLPMVESWVKVELPDTPELMEESVPAMSDTVHTDETTTESNTEPEEIASVEHLSQQDVVQETSSEVPEVEEGQDSSSEGSHRGGLWKWVVGLVVAACLLIVFFLLKPSNNKPQNDANVTSEVTESVSNETKDGAEQIEDAPSTSVGQTTLQADSEELYAAANERVKYGAYKIVGIDTIITVTPGMTLQRIATIFLGSQMMMYLSAINDGNDNPQPGEQYKIPKIKLK